MDGRQDPLSDAALDRELDAALSVEPSPEFAARVRMRVADQTVEPGWWPRLGIAAAGIGAMTLVMAVVLWPVAEPSSVVTRIAGDVALPPAVRELPPVPHTTASAGPVAARPRPPERAATGSREITLDDVIVSAEDRRGFEALLVALEEHRLPALPREDAGDDPAPPVPIEIPDVTIEPLELLRLE